jgi:transposase
MGAPITHPAFIQLQRRIVVHREAIDVALDTGLSQGLIESTNTKIRLLTRIAFGFHGYQPLISLAMLASAHTHPPPRPNMTNGNNRTAPLLLPSQGIGIIAWFMWTTPGP